MLRRFSISLMAVLAMASVVAAASVTAPVYSFPQAKNYGNGVQAEYFDNAKIRSKFATWKSSFYVEGSVKGTAAARIMFDPSSQTVSEGIGYGMLIFVYMSETSADYRTQFDKLFSYFKCFSTAGSCTSWNGEGMNWKIDGFSTVSGGGTATDAELDVALALIMAHYQWGGTYLDDAKKLIAWIRNNEINGSTYMVKPGSNWESQYNPSYLSLAAFRLFKTIDTGNETFWTNVINKATTLLTKSQNATTGLVSDWVNESGTPVMPQSAVSQSEIGFFDDAVRTPWRVAMDYYWNGTATSKTFNDKMFAWFAKPTYYNASYIMSGYSVDGSVMRTFASSSFSGGLGLAAAASKTVQNQSYVNSVYVALANKSQEKYFPATLNILYLLLVSGNMPDLSKASTLQAHPSVAAIQVVEPTGERQELATPVSGVSVWGTYGDKYGTGTEFAPDSGIYPVYLDNGDLVAKMNGTIGPEPVYDPNVDLIYPFLGLTMSFHEQNAYFNLAASKKIRLTYKSDGVMRLALLSKDREGQEEGSEFGYLLVPTFGEYSTIEISTVITKTLFEAYLGDLRQPAWADAGSVDEVLPAVRGVKFENKMPDGGYCSITVKSIAFLDDAGNNVMDNAEMVPLYNLPKVSDSRMVYRDGKLHYAGLSEHASLQLIGLDGKVLQEMSVSGSGAVSIKSFANGVTVVKLKDGAYRETRKVLVR